MVVVVAPVADIFYFCGMRLRLLVIGKTGQDFVRDGCEFYRKRLVHYIPFELNCLPEVKRNSSMTPAQMKTAESDILLKAVGPQDRLILLDENGKAFTSVEWAGFLEAELNQSRKELIFAIGGAYGFDERIRKRAQVLISLSGLTFPNQLCRLIFMEQLYRAFTIIRNESYHHA